MNKLELVKALLSDDSEEKLTDNSGNTKIVILQRGWVFVGNFYQNGSMCTLKNAQNIRTWGTTKGLGELASDGPTANTKLDKINDVTFHILTSVAMIDADNKVWKKVL